jgi:beta-phosphoglucomutase-like phosphatase (HAD superfamily)
MSKLQALLFDVDGTLVDTEELHRQAFNQAFLEFGLGWNWNKDLYAELLAVSGGAERIAHYIDWLNAPATEKTRLRRLISPVHREKTGIYGSLIAKQRGAATTWCRATDRRGPGSRIENRTCGDLCVKKCAHVARGRIVSGSTRSDLRSHQRRSGTSQEAAPDTYELLLTQLDVSVDVCMAFEDSTNGVAAAKAARLYTVATPSQWTQGYDFVDADIVLDSLGEFDMPLNPRDAASVGGARRVGLAQIETLRAKSFVRPSRMQA